MSVDKNSSDVPMEIEDWDRGDKDDTSAISSLRKECRQKISDVLKSREKHMLKEKTCDREKKKISLEKEKCDKEREKLSLEKEQYNKEKEQYEKTLGETRKENSNYKTEIDTLKDNYKTIVDKYRNIDQQNKQRFEEINNQNIKFKEKISKYKKEIDKLKNEKDSCKKHLDRCTTDSSKYSSKLTDVSRINSLSNIYILPYKEEQRLVSGNSSILSVDRFTFNMGTIVAEGSFGKIYIGEVPNVNNNPLKTINRAPKYVIKIIDVDHIDPLEVKKASIELNIQSVIFDVNVKGLKTPYIYKKMFTDPINSKIGFISEFVPNTKKVDMIISATYSAFKRDVINHLNSIYKYMDDERLDISFKHNDTHAGNILLTVVDSGNINFTLIDYGLSYIKKLYDMDVDNNVIDYISRDKIDDYIKCFIDKPKKEKYIGRNEPLYHQHLFAYNQELHTITTQFIPEFRRYMTEGVMSDYHLYVISMCHTIMVDAQNQSVSNIHIANRINNNGWPSFFNDVRYRYEFLTNLSVSGGRILYNGNYILRNPDYHYLYEKMVGIIGNRLLSPISRMFELWYIDSWRYISMFIEFYMKSVDKKAYDRCISPF